MIRLHDISHGAGKKNGKWIAVVTIKDETRQFGSFNSEEEAIEAGRASTAKMREEIEKNGMAIGSDEHVRNMRRKIRQRQKALGLR